MLERARCTQSTSLLPFPSPFMGRPVSAAEAADAAAATTASTARAAAAATEAACHYYGPGVVAAAGQGVVKLSRLTPTCPAAEPLPARLPGQRAPFRHADPPPPGPYRPGGGVAGPG